jgi:hypothetical protein
MPEFFRIRTQTLLMAAICCLACRSAPAQTAPKTPAPAERDGQHDFDFMIGTWNVHVKQRLNPLAGAPVWSEMDGVSTNRKIWDGRANMDEFEADGPRGHHESMTLRLYNPQMRQWSLFWASSRDGVLGQPPMSGGFKDGRGEFYDQELFQGKAVFVRDVWSDITPSSAHFEQSFSSDGGKTWEPNWIATYTRSAR